jgi:hypothetical protein
MNFEIAGCGRVLSLHAAAKRLQIPERTLRYQASRGRVRGAFKQGKLWKFSLSDLESAQQKRLQDRMCETVEANHVA